MKDEVLIKISKKKRKKQIVACEENIRKQIKWFWVFQLTQHNSSHAAGKHAISVCYFDTHWP
jgi:hypothetical protein